ncbi:MAG: EAL domain-containing protein [Coriobacteriales bacterium]
MCISFANEDAHTKASAELYEEIAKNLATVFDFTHVVAFPDQIVLFLTDITAMGTRVRLKRLFDPGHRALVWEGLDEMWTPLGGFAYGAPKNSGELEDMYDTALAELSTTNAEAEDCVHGKTLSLSSDAEPEEREPETGDRDQMTSLLNMDAFRQRAPKFTADPATLEKGIACVYFGFDNFSAYNERYGFNAGDKLLKETAEAIEDSFFGSLISRVSIAHFCVLCYERDAAEFASMTCNVVNRRTTSAGTKITLKTGTYYITSTTEDVGTAADKARLAYTTIERRFDEIHTLYDADLQEFETLKQYIIDNLERAIASQDIRPAYQPIVRSLTRKMTNLEILARWTDSKYGVIRPDQFIPVCEEAHLIHLLDAHVIRMACRAWRTMVDAGYPQTCLSFNVSRLDALLCDIVDVVDRAVIENQIPRSLIDIEITESAFEDVPEALARAMHEFKRRGYKLWMDDYGSGYSSLEMLSEYYFDAIKIDKKLSLGNPSDSRYDIAIACTIDMAKQIGIPVVCEGVETNERAEYLRDIGADFQQGFLYSEPVYIDELKEKVDAGELVIERPSWLGYRDAASRVNLLSPDPFVYSDAPLAVSRNQQLPLAIIERDADGDFHFMVNNEPFIKLINHMGFENTDEIVVALGCEDSPLARSIEIVFDPEGQLETDETIDFVYGGNNYSCRIRRLAVHKGNIEVLVAIRSIELSFYYTKTEIGAVSEQLSLPLQTIYSQIFIIDNAQQTITRVFRNQIDLYETFTGTVPLEQAMELFLERIFPASRDEFEKFMDQSTVAERVQKSDRTYLITPFRVLTADGTYAWETMLLIPAIIQQRESTVLAIRKTNIALFEEINTGSKSISKDQLWDTLMASTNFGIFWKDKERRFLGMNRTMMGYYGIKNLNEAIGKTDEEMDWHPNPIPFKEKEEEVLAGATVRNLEGSCITDGTVRKIRASKTPILRGDEIVGLLGYFSDASAGDGVKNAALSEPIKDELTGCLNERGFNLEAPVFCREAKQAGKVAAFIEVEIANVGYLDDVFGRRFALIVIKHIADVLVSAFGLNRIIARVGKARFFICCRVDSKDRAADAAQEVKETVDSIKSAQGIAVIVKSQVAYATSDEASTLEELHALVEERLEHEPAASFDPKSDEIEPVSLDTLQRAIRLLRKSFDIVRLVNPSLTEARDLKADGSLDETPYCCFSSWHKTERCVNCISSKAISRRTAQSKLEVAESRTFYVTSQPVLVDGQLLALEIGVAFDTEFDNPSSQVPLLVHDELGEENSYRDETTGTFNRLFYEEEASSLVASKVVLVSIDGFDELVSKHGYNFGDSVLANAAGTLLCNTRARDLVIHYDTDSFVIIFNSSMPTDAFVDRLQQIQDSIGKLEFEDAPGLKLTVSIGAVDSAGFAADLVAEATRQLVKAHDNSNGVSLFNGSLVRAR